MKRSKRDSFGLGKRAISITLSAALLLSFCTEGLFARGGFSGGGFKTPSLRSFSMPRATLPGSGRPLLGSGFSWGSSRPRSAQSSPSTAPRLASPLGSGGRSGVTAQRNLYDTARRNGTLYSNQGEATQAFKSSLGSRYDSRFAAEPTARPSWIPQYTTVGGRNLNVVYNPVLGGYGYLNPLLGTWILYDVLGDAAMASSIMGNHGYYWGSPPVYVSHGPGFIFTAFVLLLFFIVAAAMIGYLRSRSRPL